MTFIAAVPIIIIALALIAAAAFTPKESWWLAKNYWRLIRKDSTK
ncbi:hypothetical protein [Corynebacterium ulceribovis]|nr:hypothetical protein [Corynebacterium ulceribovis]